MFNDLNFHAIDEKETPIQIGMRKRETLHYGGGMTILYSENRNGCGRVVKVVAVGFCFFLLRSFLCIPEPIMPLRKQFWLATLKGTLSSSSMEHFISWQTTTNLWFFSTSGIGNALNYIDLILAPNTSHNYGSPATCMSTCFARCARYCRCFTGICSIATVKVSFVIA